MTLRASENVDRVNVAASFHESEQSQERVTKPRRTLVVVSRWSQLRRAERGAYVHTLVARMSDAYHRGRGDF